MEKLICKVKEITKDLKEEFEKNGIIEFDKLIPDENQVDILKQRAIDCFMGKGDKNCFPDTTTWMKGLSRDDVTRCLVNCWKIDSLMAQVVLNENFGKLASQLLECDSVRIVQDNILWKVVSGKSINMHQDAGYFDSFYPKKTLTLWIALTDVSIENGTLEYIPGSHKWSCSPDDSEANHEFHAPDDHIKVVKKAASRNGISNLNINYVTVKKGGASIHHPKLWHGSRTNPSTINDRIAIAIVYIPGDAQFDPNTKPCFSFARDKIFGSNEMLETFYPIVYSKNGYKSPIVPYSMDSNN